ncbi:MAG: hypothetical protein JW841_10395 [Deltaproteobacteria bacterium]|nr:hypothetical protein [Deltaproteobacteria bacterium]
MQDLLYVDAPPAGKTKLTEWIQTNAANLGRKYANELKRRRDRKGEYLSNEG